LTLLGFSSAESPRQQHFSRAIVLGVLIALFAFLILVLSAGSAGASGRFSTR
jgi:hypothetical protein